MEALLGSFSKGGTHGMSLPNPLVGLPDIEMSELTEQLEAGVTELKVAASAELMSIAAGFNLSFALW